MKVKISRMNLNRYTGEESRRKLLKILGLGALFPFDIILRSFPHLRSRFEIMDQNIDGDIHKIRQLLKSDLPVIWLFTGDSITHGAKHTHGYRSYPEVFQERIRWELGRVRDIVVNSGISGNTISNILEDFDWRVGQFRPSVVSIMIGTNDCSKQNMNPEKFGRSLEQFIDRIRSLDAIPILHTPNPIITKLAPERKTLPDYIPIIRDLAKKRNLILVDNYHWWESNRNENKTKVNKEWLNDPLHPNHKGHQQIAQTMFRALEIFDPNASTCGGEYYEGKH